MLTYGSLFTGIGGIDLGFEWAGLKCQWQVEIDPFCQQVLQKNFPDVERFTDVRRTGKANLKPVDIIVGGFPCQPHSVAGQRKGAADDRDLWSEYRRSVAELKPAYVIGENVPGIRTTILDDVLSDLESLGYTCQTFIIPACAHNAPHRRNRVWIIAYAGNSRFRELFQQKQIAKLKTSPHIGSNGEVQSLAYSNSLRELQSQRGIKNEWGRIGNGSKNVSHANGQRQKRGAAQPQQAGRQRLEGRSWWKTEPGICRVVDGFPGRVDRLKALGNAVVPQQAYFIAQLVARHSNKGMQPTAEQSALFDATGAVED